MAPGIERDTTPATDEAPRDRSEHLSAWARELASRLQRPHEVQPPADALAESWALEAQEILWSIIDQAADEATEALEQAGLGGRLEIERLSHDYRLRLRAPEGGERQITIFANVSAVEGHLSGGGHISTTATRATLDLTPIVDGERVRWIIPSSGVEFSEEILGDLLLSTFTDDAAAMGRLSPYFSFTP
jgi:hypothetical protein